MSESEQLKQLFQFEYDCNSFLSSYKAIKCTIKNEPIDFIVHEINTDMEIAYDCDQTIPELPVQQKIETEKSEQITKEETENLFYDWDDAMKQTIENYIIKCKQPHYAEELLVPIPNNLKLRPEVLQQLSENAHISMLSRQGSLLIKHNPIYDELTDIVGEEEASTILSFIIRSRVNKEQLPLYTLKTRPLEDKDQRRSVHLFCKQHYPFVKTTTDSNCIVLTIRGNLKRQQNGKERSAKKPRLSTILRFTLKKTNMELLSLKTRLCQLLRCNERALSFPGIKDKKAVTYQFATVRNVSPEMLIRAASELPAIEMGHFQYVEKELKVGELWGNQFIITLHGVEEEETVIQQVVQQMRENGFVNYYGSQRLGNTHTQDAITAAVGRFLLCGDWKKAICLLLQPGSVFTDTRSEEALQHYQQTHDAKASARLVPVSSYNLLSLLRSIHRYGCTECLFSDTPLTKLEQDVLYSVLKELPIEMLSFYIKAFQSFLFNKIVQWRISHHQKAVLPGDWILAENGNVEALSEDQCSQHVLSEVVLPLCGSEVKMPLNCVGEKYNQLFKEYTGLDMNELSRETNSLVLPGSYRVIAAQPLELESEYHKEEKAWKLSFKLKKGLYATTMINEMTACGCVQE